MSTFLFQFQVLIMSNSNNNSVYDICNYESNIQFKLFDRNNNPIKIKTIKRCIRKNYSHYKAIYTFESVIETNHHIEILNGNQRHGLVDHCIQDNNTYIYCKDANTLKITHGSFLIGTKKDTQLLDIRNTSYIACELSAAVFDEHFNRYEMSTSYYTEPSVFLKYKQNVPN